VETETLVNPADVQLVQQIQQATLGGSRLLCTLARRGKALERDEPERAEFLIAAVRLHPLYKGGRLAFDMLEIEDLMLDSAPADSMNTFELTQVLSAGARDFFDALRRSGSGAQTGPGPAQTSDGQIDSRRSSVRQDSNATGSPGTASGLPRVTFGPAHDAVAAARQSPARDEGPEGDRREPELKSSDYLYDYVVLGFLDVLGGIRMAL
jgi:hypothetical protein